MCASSTFGMCERREELKRRSIHAFYVRSRRREAQTGLRTAVGASMCCGRINMGHEDKETAENARAREGAERPSTTPGAILWARSTVNKRCPLSDSTALIYPFPRRTNAPMALNNHALLYGGYSSPVAQMNWPSILRIDMLRRASTQWKPTPACHLRTRQLIK